MKGSDKVVTLLVFTLQSGPNAVKTERGKSGPMKRSGDTKRPE